MAQGRAFCLCRNSRIVSAIVETPKKRRKRPGLHVFEGLATQNHTAPPPNELRLADATAQQTREGKGYIWAVAGLASRQIINRSIFAGMRARPCRPLGPGFLVHSDRGLNFAPGNCRAIPTITAWSVLFPESQLRATTPHGAFYFALGRKILNRLP